MPTKSITIFCCDPNTADLFRDILDSHKLTIHSELSNLMDEESYSPIITNCQDDILILSNFGIPMAWTLAHIDAVPEIRNYRVMVMGGLDQDAIDKCVSRNFAYLLAPFQIAKFMKLIETI